MSKFFTVSLPILLVSIAALFMGVSLNAQVQYGEKIEQNFVNLDKNFSSWEIYRLDIPSFYEKVQADADQQITHRMVLGSHNWNLQLAPNPILAPNYRLELEENGTRTVIPNTAIPLKGTAGNQIRLTVDADFLDGFVQDGAENWYIEPVWYFDPTAAHDLYVVYPKSAVLEGPEATCGTQHFGQNLIKHAEEQLHEEKQTGAESVLACYELDLAIASDNAMLLKYGSASAVQNHNIAVINNVEGDYTGNFNHDIQFNIVINLVSSSNPWTSNPDPNTYLSNFRNWGQSGGFGVPFDLGELWTDIDLTGSVIGIAYLSAVCTSNKYHVLQDFSGNAELLRCLASHEIGHNFSATHDNCPGGGATFIMCPFVTTSTDWSGTSVSQISSFITTRINNGCLSPCGNGGVAPIPNFSWNPNPGCVNQQISFTDESTGTINTRNWTFTGGTPATSTTANPVVTWSTAGVKNVTLTLNQGSNISATITKQVTILGLPTVNFTSTVNGLTVTFDATAPNATDYNWDFGDGDYAIDEDPIHTYLVGGFYTVKLTVTGPCGSATKTVTINTAPSPEFDASVNTGCAPLSVVFANLSSNNATSFLWQFPGGTPATSALNSPSVQYNTPGTYSVSLTAFNVNGSVILTKLNYITVKGVPTASFTSTNIGNTVSFTNTSTGATSYSWDFGDGNNSTDANPQHTYSVGGNYTVVLTTTNECGSNSATKLIILLAPPTASFTANPTAGCSPLAVQFTSTSTGNPTTYNWQFPGGNPSSSTLANPTVLYANAGTYTVVLTVGNQAGSTTATQTGLVVVTSAPVANFTASTNGATVTFTNTTTGGATGYSWNFGNGNSSTATNPTHTYAADGVYTVVLTATNACGTTTSTRTVTIVTPPSASFTANNTTGCAPQTVQFTSTSSSNSATFNWQFPGGSPSSSTVQNPAVVYATPGIYSVTLTVSNAAGTNTATQTNLVNILAAPIAAFTPTTNGLQVAFNNTTTNGTSYTWGFGDGNTSTATNPTHTYSTVGNYTVTLTATNTCGSNTTTRTVNIVAAPTASFTATPTQGCGTLTVQFNSTSTGNPATFAWQFPGGTPSSSSLPNPIVFYSAPGQYSVTLVASNIAGSGTNTQANLIQVGTGPSAGFSATTNGGIASFNNTSTGGTAYSWAFGDGGVSTMISPSHTYTADGNYTVTLTTTNACGSATATQNVTIITPPSASFTATGTAGCAPMTVQFNNGSSSNATSFLWQFAGGTPSSSTLANPSIQYTTPGVYSVSLIATNSAGSSTVTQQNFVTVLGPPAPGFIPNINGSTVSLSNTSTNATSYNWNFGDGNTNATNSPSHVYIADGVYTITLTATNNCGTTTSTQTITILTPPTANFTAAGNIGCAPLTVQFNNTSSTNETAFNWQFAGGSPATSTSASPSVVYATPGTYSVTLTVSNGAGSATVTQTGFVIVNSTPAAAFSTSVTGSNVVFTNTTTQASAYSWAFGDGTTNTDANPTHTYTTDGIYTITLTASNNCGTAVSTATVVIQTPPNAGFSVAGNTGCAPLTATFTNTSSSNATDFLWQFPGGEPSSSTQANPTVVYATPGTYNVVLTASNGAGSTTATQTNIVVVNGTPTPNFIFQTGGLSVIFTNQSTNADTYLWSFGDNATSTEASPIHTYAATGTYIVTLVTINACGTNEVVETITITGTAPIASFTIGGEGTAQGCAPLTVQFQDASVGNPTSWSWAFEGGTPPTSTEQNPLVTYATPGSYQVILNATNLFGTNTVSQEGVVQVLTAPEALFTYDTLGGKVNFTNNSVGATTYSWDFGDGSPASSEVNPSHSYAQNGTYTVILTATNACGVVSYTQVVDYITTGTGEADWVQSFRLYPNPNTGLFYVELSGLPQDEVELVLYNTLGQLIRTETVAFGSGQLRKELRYEDLASGYYMLAIRSGANILQARVIVTKS